MKLLFLCNTLYQIIAASCIRDMYPNEEAELILSDHSVGHKKIYESFKQKHLIFDNVYFVKTKHLYEKDKSLSRKQLFQELRNDKSFSDLLSIPKQYDAFFCANAEPFSTRLVNYLKRNNPHIDINWFEDGLSVYYFDQRYFPSIKGRIKNAIKELIFGIYSVTGVVQNCYAFLPDKMDWSPRAEVKKIRAISKETTDHLSMIFDYDNCPDRYEEKYIFFEDGMRNWDDDLDVRLLEEIATFVGKENIIVKIHPRDLKNRFSSRGFKTNIDMSIPWEVIAPKIDIENKILITMFSQSVIIPEILTGKNGKVIALGYLESSPPKGAIGNFSFMERQFFSNKDRYFIPKSLDEMRKCFQAVLN